MARRRNADEAGGRPQDVPVTLPARVLVVGAGPERERIGAMLAGRAASCELASSVDEAFRRMAEHACDVIVVSRTLPGALELAEQVSRTGRATAVVLLEDHPTLDGAVDAMRRGVCDILPTGVSAGELLDRLRDAATRALALRAREERIVRLRRVCKRLNQVRQDVTKQVGTLCDDLSTAYQSLSERVAQLSVAGEFNGLIRQELDLESLLRTTLEFVLAKIGPTNAAVFLPSSSGDFSLGAYVNYTCAKDTADVLLDQLANAVAPRMEGREGIVRLTDPSAVHEFLGETSSWVGDANLVAFSCRDDGECLSVVVLFRDRHSPFPDSLTPIVATIQELFARQLARVVRIHHRHLPESEWGLLGDDEDLAA